VASFGAVFCIVDAARPDRSTGGELFFIVGAAICLMWLSKPGTANARPTEAGTHAGGNKKAID
jgi:hypothetical protein